MKIVVTGGGTGGHVFVALEIIKEFRKHMDKHDVVWAGNDQSFEQKTASAHDIVFFPLHAEKILGQSLQKKIKAAFALILACIHCLRFLIKHRPKAVIGVGGYVSAPMIMASFFLGIKRYIAEQNVTPGLANRYLGKLAHTVFISFAQASSHFNAQKTVLSGNPVREEFFAIPNKTYDQTLKILITGGSLGARAINTVIPTVLGALKDECPDILVTHQTGQNMVEAVKKSYEDQGVNATVTPFITDMPKAFLQHNMLISRAGATVIAEITAAGVPAILIPYPYALGHQQDNALALENKHAAVMILEGKDFAEHLATTLKSLYSDRSILHTMAERARSMGIPHAAHTMVQHILLDIQH